MQNNVRQVRMSEPLREASHALLDRSLDHWRVLDACGGMPAVPHGPGRPEGQPARAGSGGGSHMSERMRVAKAYEAALFAGRMDEVGAVHGGRRGVLGGRAAADRRRVAGARAPCSARSSAASSDSGTADWGYEDLERTWYEAEDRVIVEIRERSWLRSAAGDVLDQRTCVVIRFRDGLIAEMRDYTDTAAYEAFIERHRQRAAQVRGRRVTLSEGE